MTSAEVKIVDKLWEYFWDHLGHRAAGQVGDELEVPVYDRVGRTFRHAKAELENYGKDQ